ncbi:uncharacterized protein LOC6733089 isoform X1 [Drosophila simulans]|uniref:uncharacterized protein LOC6733089 isoform X1 n=1 Tax=Drosophila simulans TaxID=7240 RepID=UPI00192CEF1C|nr:uncharacterized protein LOC6733089 isoform X1 [Drosophila simulans]XP_039146950.1 uncharacterized protein LOC6733089 isoform X1 [Drosophila simulans]XP_039146951.1 uncharacterized protein LOC6733089 isoform X1 [Drosophila simulans]XP_039146952.1 uncharacterized protein LOC6733089 isoform X1 [Drosophila simulans]
MAAAHESTKARDSTNVETERTFHLEAGQSYDTMAESHRAFHSLELETGAEVALELDAAVEANQKGQNDNQLQSLEPISLDDIPEPIKVLDEIISEFEEAATKPVALNCNSGENQSEDDGYMSLSRKNMSKKDSEDVPQTPSTDTVPEGSFNEVDGTAENLTKLSEVVHEQETTSPLIQTTLPKARGSSSTPAVNSNYSSLPCCGARASNLGGASTANSSSRLSAIRHPGSCNEGRNALGIDISAVHNAVLRGNLAKLPEPFVNEHPVTIYPGPSSKAAMGEGARCKRLLSSVEKHKEVCHMLNPLSSGSNSSSGEASPAASHVNVATSKAAARDEEYSEDSLEESTISTELTPVKQNGVAWEIHFKSNKKKSSGLKNTSASKTKTHNLDGSSIYNERSMLGKGTFIIRRSTAKNPPRVTDVFCMPKPPRSSLAEGVETKVGAGAISNEFYTSDSEQSDATPLPLPLPPASSEINFVYKESEANAEHTRRGLEMVAAHRAILSLDIESPEQLRYCKPAKSKTAMLTEKRLSAESMPDNTSSSEEFDEARLNGSGSYELYGYNDQRASNATTPHTDLAPTLEEDEELSDLSYGCAPLMQIEHNISALLRGDIPIIGQPAENKGGGLTGAATTAAELHAKRVLEFRHGVHKSESAKEMLLSQMPSLGPLPPSPPSSNPDLFDYDAPLPPSPVEPRKQLELPVVPNAPSANRGTTVVEVHATASGTAVNSSNSNTRRSRDNIASARHFTDELPPPPALSHQSAILLEGNGGPPMVPPHRGTGGHSANTMKSWSIDSQYRKKSPKLFGHYSSGGSGITTPTGLGPIPPLPPPHFDGMAGGSGSYHRRYINYGTKRNLKQSPREEHRLQTSCSLPETPIFARGCDIPRTPYRRQNEPLPVVSGSRTAPRSSTSNSISMGASILGIGGGNYGTAQICRQRSINHALASNEMLRMTGAPARGWYPKQRGMRPVSTENIDRLASMRVWDNSTGMSGTGQSRKPLTLPPNLTPSFLNKSPREALRRVTSLLITKKKSSKDRKHKTYCDQLMDDNNSKHVYEFESVFFLGSTTGKDTNRNDNGDSGATTNNKPKKKGLFKSLWKRSKTVSLDQ